MVKNYQIGVIGGLGHIGLIQAACLARLGYKTRAYDIDTKKLKGVLKGRMPFREPGLTELVMETLNNGLLKFTARIDELAEAEIIFICVGTPSLPNGEADLSQVYSAVEKIAKNRSKHCLGVVKSTVPVGTSRNLTRYLMENNYSGKITMVSNPEFLREGSGVTDFWEPARIVVGGEREAAETVAQLYAPPGVPVITTSWENSELIKYASNAFLAAKISYINEIAHLCEKIGADIRIISRGIGLDPRINPHFLGAGAGFSGPCLEKDLKSLIAQFEKVQREAKILKSVLQVNEDQRKGLVKKLQEYLGGSLKGKKIGVLGMAFKEETDDVRQSHSLPIVKELLSLEAVVTVSDCWVNNVEEAGLSESELPGVEWVSSPYETASDKDAVLILTAWQEYKELELQRLRDSMRNPLIVDGRNLFKPKDMEALQIEYVGVGI